MEKKNKMETMPMGKLVLNMSLPMMVSLLVQSLYNIVDSIFVAKISEQALTAASLAYPVQMLMIAVGVGTAVGLNAVLSKTLGQKNYEEASQVAMTGLLLSVLCAAIFSMAGFAASERIAHSFTDRSEIAAMCADYLWICMVFCLGNMVCMVFQRLLQASGNTFLSMVILVSGAITNIVMDPILIFGLGSVPSMGIRGAAWATVIGQWVSMIVGFVLNRMCNPDVQMTLKGFSFRMERVRRIYHVGLPTIIMQAMTSVMVTTFNGILNPISSTAVAFFGVYYKLQNFLFMPMNGLGQAAIPIVGFNLGAKHKDRIFSGAKITYLASMAIGLCGTILFLLFGKVFLRMFSAGDAMLSIGIPALKIICLSFVPAAFTIITGYIASGLGDGLTNMLGAFLRQFCPLIPCAVFLAHLVGPQSIWYAFWISEITAAVFAGYRLKHLIQSKLSQL